MTRREATTPPPPSGLAVARQIAAMSLRRARRGRTLWLSVVILGLVVASALASLLSGRGGVDYYRAALDLVLRYIVPFIMLLHASAAVAEEVQARTITYLFSRPIARWALPVGKYVGSLVLGLGLALPALVLVYVIGMLAEPAELWAELSQLGRGLVATSLAVVLYGAIATAFGTMVTSYSFVAALVYVLVVEVSFSFVPGWLKVVAMSVHLRVVAGLYKPETTLFMSDPSLSAAVALPVVLGEVLLWLMVAVTWVQSTEYRTEK